MKVVFYSTNSNYYNSETMDYKMFPSCDSQWKLIKQKYPQFEFVVVMQKPGMFLYDGMENDFVEYVFVPENKSSASDIAKIILEQKPEIAIAVTYWVQPFDWLSIKDSVIAERLRLAGIKCVCHSSKTAAICFDKYKTHLFLEQNNFNCAKGVYVHHEMFYAERNKKCISENVYREYVFSEIEKLNFPVVIKDTTGLSSFGMDVVKTFAEAKHILLSKKNNGDRLVEEFLDGDSFGIEVYGTDGNYTISSVLINSVNQFGLTSPKQNVKLGPVVNSSYKIESLKSEILRLSKLLNFSGIAQIDLLYSNDKWYIIEINSRVSGMTQTMAASYGISLYEMILFSAGLIQLKGENSFVLNMKFPLLTFDELEKMAKTNFVYAVNQIENKQAKQLREVGYAEVIIANSKNIEEILEKLDELNLIFSKKMEGIFYKNAKKLAMMI